MLIGMEINPHRLIGITQFRQNAAAIMDEVNAGKTFHLMRDTDVIGHIVPPTALLISNENVEYTLLSTLITATADRFATEIISGGYLGHVGDDVGPIIAWLWNADPTTAARWVTFYARRLTNTLRDNRYSRPALSQLWYALSQGLGVSMPNADIDDFGRYLHTEIPRWDADLFTATELAGNPRPRDYDDPWPDAQRQGDRGYTKRRWCHLEPGQFIPNPTSGHELPTGEQWCRIENIAGPNAELTRSDDSAVKATIADVATWLPVIDDQPYYWSLP